MISIFLDNDATHIKDVKEKNPKNTYTIKISENSSIPSIDKFTFLQYDDRQHDALFQRYTKRVSEDNTYVRFLNTLHPKQRLYPNLPNNGVSNNDFDNIEAIMDSHPGKKIAVFFDFDRTLSQSEGMYLLNDQLISHYIIFFRQLNIDFSKERYMNDMAEYLYGPERMEMLKTRLNQLHKKGAELYILTANTECQNHRPKSSLLFELINKIYPFDRNHILCSADYENSKGKAIKMVHDIYDMEKELKSSYPTRTFEVFDVDENDHSSPSSSSSSSSPSSSTRTFEIFDVDENGHSSAFRSYKKRILTKCKSRKSVKNNRKSPTKRKSVKNKRSS